MGFLVYGVKGFKVLKKEGGHFDGKQSGVLDYLVDLTQIITYYWPVSAFQLFCVKNL